MKIKAFNQRLIDGREDVDPSAVQSVVQSMFTVSAPSSEATAPAVGVLKAIPYSDHAHARLTSATIGVVASGNTVDMTFTRLFSSEPNIDYIELPPASTTTTPVAGDTAATAQPTTCKVIAWKMDTTDPTKFAGCTVRVFKSQTIPQNLVTLLVGAVFNLFGASVVGTRFSLIALARSDV